MFQQRFNSIYYTLFCGFRLPDSKCFIQYFDYTKEYSDVIFRLICNKTCFQGKMIWILMDRSGGPFGYSG